MNDRARAVTWAREHWHVALFVCAAIPVGAALLVYLHVLTERAAWAAAAGSVVYVLLTTWLYTRPGARPPSTNNEP